MGWTIRYAASAARAIRKLDPGIRRKVHGAILRLARDHERGKPLQLSLKGLRSWRTSDFRIVYQVRSEQIEVIVVAVGHRSEVYSRIRGRWKSDT